RFVALRGSEEEVRRVATAYKIYFEKVRPPGSSVYLIDHMAFVFLLDRDGRYVAFFPPGTTAERMAVMVGEVLAHSGLRSTPPRPAALFAVPCRALPAPRKPTPRCTWCSALASAAPAFPARETASPISRPC